MRDRHNRAWWRQTVGQWQGSNQTAEQFGAEKDLHPASLRLWRRQFALDNRPADGSLRLVRVELTGQSPRSCPPALISAVIGPAELRFSVGTDPKYLSALIIAIGSTPPC